MDSCDVEVMELPAFAAMVVRMLVPFRYKTGTSKDEPITAEPLMSIEGAVTGAENTALPAEIPSRSTPSGSAKLRVPDAGFTRAQVSWLRLSTDELVSVACFCASASVSPVTSPMAAGPVDA